MKPIYPIETTYAYSHATQYHATNSWKPRMLRPLGIAFLLFCMVAVIGLLEGAARALPRRNNPLFNSLFNRTDFILKHERILERQDSTYNPSDDEMSSILDSFQISDGNSEYGPTYSAAPTDFLGNDVTYSLPPETDFLSNGGEAFTQLGQQTPAAGGVNGGVVVTPSPTPTAPEQPPPSDFIDSISQGIEPAGDPPSTDFIDVTPSSTISVGEPPPTDYVTPNLEPFTQSLGSNSGSTYRQTITQTITVTAITNKQNPWFNPALYPPQKETGPFIKYVVVTTWPRWASFLGSGAFAVLLLAALQGIWSIFYSQVILVEPFASMALAKGASARDALFAKYTKRSLLFGPFQSFRSHRWVYFLASLAALLSTVVPSLGSEVLLTDTHSCDNSPPGYSLEGKNPCPPQLMVNIEAIRALQAILGVTMIIVVTIGVLLHFRQTNGVSSEPSSIAMVASLLHHPEIVRILRSIPPDTTSQDLKNILGAYHFRLTSYEAVDGTWRYGIVPMEKFVPIEGLTTPSSMTWKESNWFTWLHDMFLAAILLGLLGVIVAYYKISDQQNKFNLFFMGQSFGARFILTGTGSIIAALWHNIFSEVDVKSIFSQLSRGRARAENTVLAKRSSTAATSIVPSLTQGGHFASIVAATDLLALVLIIALPGVPFRSGMSQLEYRICTYVCMTGIGIMLIVLLFMAFWRGRLPKWPRQPDCLATTMTYLVDSDLIVHYHRASEIGQSQESAATTIKYSKWAFDRCVGPDGIVRWTVVEDKGAALMTPSSGDSQVFY